MLSNLIFQLGLATLVRSGIALSRTWAFLAALLFLSCTCQALARPTAGLQGASATCPPAPDALSPELFSAAEKQAQDRGFLWRITKDDRVSYLYGTLHVGKADWMAPGPLIRQALAETDLTALEIDPLDPQIREEMGDAAVLQSGHKPVAKALRQRLLKIWRDQCLPESTFNDAAPELQVMTLTFMVGRSDGLQPMYGAEVMLSMLAHGESREVVSLESGASQLAVLLDTQGSDASASLQQTLRDLEQGQSRRLLLRLSKVWEQADWVALTHYADWCECLRTAQDRAQLKRLLDDRNLPLAERIDALHAAQKRVFTAVGALHMVGPNGLPALLAQRGYRIERLR
jgi:uncharacterized protein YbaP (TraB family)